MVDAYLTLRPPRWEAILIRERDPFGRALATLRVRLRAGAYGQGQPLAIVELARELDLSPTPVREALSRLAGQGLVEDRRGRGYFSPRLEALDLAELYDLSAVHVRLALQGLDAVGRRRRSPDTVSARTVLETLGEAASSPDALAGVYETLLEHIVLVAGNRTLLVQHRITSDRLGPARRVEPLVLGDVRAELAELADRFDAADWRGVDVAAQAALARRREASAEIAAVLRERYLSI
jgi:DNA-binding GntR family transcriptional regulator